MSFGQDSCNLNGGMDEYYEGLDPNWPHNPYAAVSHPYNAPTEYHPSAVLTPISLPDNSYVPTRTSPVLSHHSQEYQYPVSDSIGHHGLGITTPYPSELTGNPNYGLGIAPCGYGVRDDTFSPQPARTRARRESKQPVQRELPVSIAPNPEGVQRLEEQRRQNQADPSFQRRAPGRSRKDSKQAEEEDDYVEQLRAQKQSWKVVQDMFREKYGKFATEASLQMRQVRRRKERDAQARWGKHDVQALLRARQYWEREKYRFIAEKMTELGATNSFTPEQCEAQLESIDAQEREQEREREAQERENIEHSQQSRETNTRRKRQRRRTESEESEEPPQQKKPKRRAQTMESHFQPN